MLSVWPRDAKRKHHCSNAERRWAYQQIKWLQSPSRLFSRPWQICPLICNFAAHPFPPLFFIQCFITIFLTVSLLFSFRDTLRHSDLRRLESVHVGFTLLVSCQYLIYFFFFFFHCFIAIFRGGDWDGKQNFNRGKLYAIETH